MVEYTIIVGIAFSIFSGFSLYYWILIKRSNATASNSGDLSNAFAVITAFLGDFSQYYKKSTAAHDLEVDGSEGSVLVIS